MKESNSSSHNKMIDGNWVLKRKRKRVLCRPDLSSKKESLSANLSRKPIPILSRPGKKNKGNDGPCITCEECNLGGNLLRCNSCPRSFHFDCLKPPLKRAPPRRWYCSSCTKKSRTKVSLGKSTVDPSNSVSTIKGKAVISQAPESREIGPSEEFSRVPNNGSFGGKFVLPFDRSLQKARKKRPKKIKEDVKNKSSKDHHLLSSAENSEGIHEGASNPRSPNTQEKKSCEKAAEHDPTFPDNQQVDRILGCRLQDCCSCLNTNELTENSSKTTCSDLENIDGCDKEDRIKDVDGQSQTAEASEPDNMTKSVGKDLPLQESNDVNYEFLVKWVGLSNIHNTWVPESQLKVLAKRKLENYKAKYGTSTINICEEQWTQPQRVIGLRELDKDIKEAFIKWRGLPYDECTWERLDGLALNENCQLIEEFNQFESRALEKVNFQVNSLRVKGGGQDLSPLLEQPGELKGGSLFPHQLEALNWLRKCWHKGKNVILADEMGLGKTVSACAFLSSLYYEFKATLPCLVLVPLSTMPNWLAEFSLWAPHLNVVEYHGCAKARATIRAHEWHPIGSDGGRLTVSYKFNVLLTTYEMILADASHLRSIPWEVLIVDEGHRLKNSESKLFNLLNTFSFQHRVLLTGTPLQNNIGEMYNLLNFLQPASFPSLLAFEEKFTDLTTAEKVDELKKLVSPHMLRRLKKEAMQNIPPKTERMAPVELTSIQAEYYRAMLTKNYQILRNIGKGVAQQSMLNIVMQLRKVCNHPYLIPGTEPESGTVEFLQEMRIKASGKLALLHSMLKVLHKEGHRVLIFSQMTKLLDILEDYLTVEYGSKSFERVDGSVSVTDRQSAIARFNQDKSRFVFLLSTRSCGLGINLATADTVIIYDSDFNPHADIQAMNRAHRIGQSNRLLVYRLVVRASVEERILQLAKKKLMLDQLFVNKSETQKEVEDILRWGTEELFSEVDQNDAGNLKSEGAISEIEQKGRRRSGGLGDVYQDKCMDVSNKIIWDESAIMKLLDRSDLQGSVAENGDADMENDLLGSVKSIEWNEDLAEEQGGAETNTLAGNDSCAHTLDAKDDNSISHTEENEWDRLLRVRWERYKTEKEASLGRGKRQRKAISYKESFGQIASEALTESGNEEDERVPEKTSAGQAFKAKFSRLRARQKERLSRRSNAIMELTCAPETIKEADETPNPTKPAESPVDQNIPSRDSAEATNASSSKIGHMEEQRNPGFQGKTDPLPVLGLCAPNAEKMQNFLSPNVPSLGERRSHFESLMSSEVFNRCMKGIATGAGFPFNLGKPPLEHRTKAVLPSFVPPFLERESHLSTFQESLSKFPIPNFLPNLSPDHVKPDNLQDSLSLPPFPLFHPHLLPDKNPRQNPVPLPENHRKVLDSILMRTGGGPMVGPPKKKSKPDSWTEDELDSLWIGVRRHGPFSWESLLRDPKLKFSKYRLPEDLSSKWAEEVKILNGPPKPPPSDFPSLSDGIMTRALFGSRFSGNFHSHLTDIKLSSGSVEKSMPIRVPVDFGAGPSDRPAGPSTLPHWLRDVVGQKSAGPPPPQKPELPPAVSAVTNSVRVLYERESSIIPPFIVPGPLPGPPKDPKVYQKKKRKMKKRIHRDESFSEGEEETELERGSPLGDRERKGKSIVIEDGEDEDEL